MDKLGGFWGSAHEFLQKVIKIETETQDEEVGRRWYYEASSAADAHR